MPRPVRIQYAGAVYHVMCRGDRREAICPLDQAPVLSRPCLGSSASTGFHLIGPCTCGPCGRSGASQTSSFRSGTSERGRRGRGQSVHMCRSALAAAGGDETPILGLAGVSRSRTRSTTGEILMSLRDNKQTCAPLAPLLITPETRWRTTQPPCQSMCASGADGGRRQECRRSLTSPAPHLRATFPNWTHLRSHPASGCGKISAGVHFFRG